MSYLEELKEFKATHTYSSITVVLWVEVHSVMF